MFTVPEYLIIEPVSSSYYSEDYFPYQYILKQNVIPYVFRPFILRYTSITLHFKRFEDFPFQGIPEIHNRPEKCFISLFSPSHKALNKYDMNELVVYNLKMFQPNIIVSKGIIVSK